MFNKNNNSEKQRFSIKKYSFGVTSALVGVFLAAGVNSAEAQEGTGTQAEPVVASTEASAPAPTVKASETVKTQIVATNQALQTNKQEVAKQEEVVAPLQTQTEAKRAEFNTASENLKQAETNLTNATPENIANTQKTIDSTKETIAKTQTSLADLKTKEAEVTKDLSSLTNKTQEESSKLDTAKKQVSDVETKISDLESDKEVERKVAVEKEVSSLENTVKTNQANFDSTSQKLTQAEKTLADTQVAVDKRTKELEDAVVKAGDKLLKKIVETEEVVNAVEKEDSESTPVNETVDYDGGKAPYLVNENIDFSGERVETIVLKKEEIKQGTWGEEVVVSRPIDWKKVSEYAREYLVELRKLNGIDIPVPEVTDKALAWAKARSEEMTENNKLSHNTVLKVADFGLTNETENATGGTAFLKTNPQPQYSNWINKYLSEKEIAYNEVLNYFNDFNNASYYWDRKTGAPTTRNYGHRIPLLAASGTGFALGGSEKGYGIMTWVSDNKDVYATLPSVVDPSAKLSYVSSVTGETVYFDPYSSYFLTKIENKDSDPQRSEFYFNGKRVKFLPKITFRYVTEEEVTYENTKRTEADKALADYKTSSAKDLADKSTQVTNLKTEKITAQNTLNENTAKLNVQKTLLDDINKALVDKAGTLDRLRNDLVNAKDVLQKAQSSYDTALNNEKAKAAELANLKSEIANKEKTIAELQKTLAETEKLLNALQNAPELLKQAKEKYDSLLAEYNELRNKLDKEQGTLGGLLEEQTNLLKKLQELKDEYIKLLEKENPDYVITVTDEGEVTMVPKDAPVAGDKPELPLDLFKKDGGKTKGKQKSSKARVLPKTSATKETNSTLPAGLAAALAGAGLLAVKRRKEN